MIAVMICAALAWLRRPESRRGTANSWLERTRRATFGANVSIAGHGYVPNASFDQDEQARLAYNDWLAAIAQERSE
jgi:hypothetical protein